MKYGDGSTDIQQRLGFNTLREAEDARNEVIGRLQDYSFVIYPNIKVKDYFEYWLEEVMYNINRIEYSTYVTYKNAIKYIVKDYGELKMTTLNAGHVQRLYKKVSSEYKSEVKIVRCVMKLALEYARKINVVSTNVADGINLPKTVKLEPYRTINIDSSKTYNISQVRHLLECAKDSSIYLEVMFAVLTGARISEIIGLKYSDIDYINRKIHICRQLGKVSDDSNIKPKTVTKQEKKLKTISSDRWVDIPDILFNAIIEKRKYYEERRHRRINDKTNPFIDEDFICCSSYGHSRSRNHHTKPYTEFIKKSGLPYIYFHDLRHTYATILLKANHSVKAVSELLGHANEIITVDVYTDKTKIVQDCLDVLTSYIEEVKPSATTEYNDCSDVVVDVESYLSY